MVWFMVFNATFNVSIYEVYNFQSIPLDIPRGVKHVFGRSIPSRVYSYCIYVFGYSSIHHVLPMSNKVCVL
jgi:hypothetical protein